MRPGVRRRWQRRVVGDAVSEERVALVEQFVGQGGDGVPEGVKLRLGAPGGDTPQVPRRSGVVQESEEGVDVGAVLLQRGRSSVRPTRARCSAGAS